LQKIHATAVAALQRLSLVPASNGGRENRYFVNSNNQPALTATKKATALAKVQRSKATAPTVANLNNL